MLFFSKQGLFYVASWMKPTKEAPPKKRPAGHLTSATSIPKAKVKSKGKPNPKSSGMKRPAATEETPDTTAEPVDDPGLKKETLEKEKSAPKTKAKAKGPKVKAKAKASAKSAPKVKAKAKAKAKVKPTPKASEDQKPGPGRRTRKRVTAVGSLNCFKGCPSNS